MKSSKRSTRRARQTRLDFTPVPSSSPAAAQLSPHVRDHAAAVDYVGSPSPSKRQKIKDEDGTPGTNGAQAALPTPERSSQLHPLATQSKTRKMSSIKQDSDTEEGGNNDSDSDSDAVTLTQRASRRTNTFLNSGVQKSQNKLNFTQPEGKRLTFKNESDRSSEEMPPRKRPSPDAARIGSSMKASSQVSGRAAGSPPTTKHMTRAWNRMKSQKKTVVISSDEEDSDDREVVDGPSKSPQGHDGFGEPESSGDDILASSPGFKAKQKGAKQIPEIYSGEENSDDDLPITPRKRRASTVLETDDDEDVMTTQRRRNRSASRQRREKEELAEDLEFLEPSPTKLRSRRSPPRVMNARQRALETLKRRRAGEKADLPVAEEPTERRPRRVLYDTESESGSDNDDEPDQDDDDDEVPEEPRNAVHQASTMDMFQEDDDDENFVVEDEDGTLGVPAEEARLPLAFSSMSRMKGKDLFKYAVEWMVQKKLNPAFPIGDEIYDLTFRKLDDEVRGLAGSKFTSSAWTKDFTRALHARPLIEISEITGASRTLLEDHCGACNRKGHPATFNIRFTGNPYHRETLEEVDDDDEDSDDEDADDQSYDAHGNDIPSEDTVFHVGVFCKNNAQTAHALAHWRYHLNEWVVDWLRAEGHLDANKIVERDGWKTKKRMKYANDVVDEMERKGEIRRLYRDFRTEIDHARNAKQAGWDRYGGRD